MFDFLTNQIENALNLVGGIFEGELPTSNQLAQMIAGGMTVAAIATSFGVAEDVIENMIK